MSDVNSAVRAEVLTRQSVRLGALLISLARVSLGVLWAHEGYAKYHAGFGGADIQLVVDSAANNSRVPGFFVEFANTVLAPLHNEFGVLIPALEVGLGVLLILGIAALPAAALSIATLMLYWMADQLIAQYPVMVVLSAAVLLFPLAASRYSVTRAVLRHRSAERISRWL